MKSSDVKSVSESDFRSKKVDKRGTVVHPEPKARQAGKNGAGRPNCLDEEKLTRLFDAYYSRPYSLRELADMFGVSRMTVWRAVQEAPGFPR